MFNLQNLLSPVIFFLSVDLTASSAETTAVSDLCLILEKLSFSDPWNWLLMTKMRI